MERPLLVVWGAFQASAGPLGVWGGGGEWEAGQLECAAGGRLRCQAGMSGGVQGLLLDEAVLRTEAQGLRPQEIQDWESWEWSWVLGHKGHRLALLSEGLWSVLLGDI